jgi:hypothetical protein
MSMVCENPLCSRNEPMPSSENLSSVVLIEEGYRTLVNRHLYRCQPGMEFWLCDVCHSAVQLVVSPDL